MATPIRLILASASPARRELMERAGYNFEVIPSDVPEPSPNQFPGPREYVQHVAWLKAHAVAQGVDDGLILAADSISWHDGQGIGKPVDEADARRIISDLMGTRHELWTGGCLWRRPSDVQVCWQERSIVEMKAFSDEELNRYVKSGAWRGKAGGYAIEEKDDPYVRVVDGSISNVIGLGIEKTRSVLSEHMN